MYLVDHHAHSDWTAGHHLHRDIVCPSVPGLCSPHDARGSRATRTPRLAVLALLLQGAPGCVLELEAGFRGAGGDGAPFALQVRHATFIHQPLLDCELVSCVGVPSLATLVGFQGRCGCLGVARHQVQGGQLKEGRTTLTTVKLARLLASNQIIPTVGGFGYNKLCACMCPLDLCAVDAQTVTECLRGAKGPAAPTLALVQDGAHAPRPLGRGLEGGGDLAPVGTLVQAQEGPVLQRGHLGPRRGANIDEH